MVGRLGSRPIPSKFFTIHHSPHRHLWADGLETVEASTSHNPMGPKACYRDSLARKADNLTAIWESIFYKMGAPRRLTTLRASTACYRNTFYRYQVSYLSTLHDLGIDSVVKQTPKDNQLQPFTHIPYITHERHGWIRGLTWCIKVKFREYELPTSSGSRSKPLLACFLFRILFDPKQGASGFLRNNSELLPDYTVLHPRGCIRNKKKPSRERYCKF
jgi:hypothetical protein